jgi:hypothetical protein
MATRDRAWVWENRTDAETVAAELNERDRQPETASSATTTGSSWPTAELGRWLAYLRLEDPPGLSPITTVGRYNSVEEAQVATDEVWTCR